MEAKWFNVYGLIFVAVILIPNVIFAMKCKDGFVNKWNNKLVETVEQMEEAVFELLEERQRKLQRNKGMER